eukprot:CAMPEP_0198286456 /NCGR_PEP_ID=MMETSP1449-20131203/5541_1 /TAXON_ID=420275 /ORGANISM="Attheya septentrionalis, Strain CCMP2084" /LENGTH=344 /DNA_ID=CAMNT_0043984211 /DNA_START=282 /DNA_END=1316 /DNA_ORIENTATION=-
MGRRTTRVGVVALVLVTLTALPSFKSLSSHFPLKSASVSHLASPKDPVGAEVNVHESFGYCEYDGSMDTTGSDCYKLLSPHLQSKPAWHFFGDSQMGILVVLELHHPHKSKHGARGDKRCNFLNYVRLEKRSQWVPPAQLQMKGEGGLTTQSQGPMVNGLENPFCTDLMGFTSISFLTETKNYWEYLPVEYASDVEQQTPYTNTTQETLAMFLANELVDRNLTMKENVCIVSNGLHDQKLCANKTKEECLDMYTTNVNTYLELLEPVCGHIVWLGITPVQEDDKFLQTNEVGLKWNQAIQTLLKARGGFFVDTWNETLKFDHTDNIHLVRDYYKSVGKLFSSLM